MGIQYIKASNGKTYPVDSSLSDEEAIEYVIKQIKGPESKKSPSENKKHQNQINDAIAKQAKEIENKGSLTPKKESLMDKYERISGDYTNNGAPSKPDFVNSSNALRYGVKAPIAGGLTTGRNIYNAIKKITLADQMAPGLKSDKPPTDFYKMMGIHDKGMADEIAGAAPEYIAGAFIPPIRGLGALGKAAPVAEAIASHPRTAKALGAVLGEAIPQSAYTYATSEHGPGEAAATTAATTAPFSLAKLASQSPNPFVRGAAKLGASGLGYLTGHAAGKQFSDSSLTQHGAGTLSGILAAFGIRNPGSKIAQNTIDNMQGFENKLLSKAAKRQGQHVYPYEVAKSNPVVKATYEGANYSPEHVSKLAHAENSRVARQGTGIDELTNTMYDKNVMGPKKSALYKEAGSKTIPLETRKAFHQNKNWKDIIDEAKTDTHFIEKYGNANPDSVEYADAIIRRMDKKISDGKIPGTPKSLNREQITDLKKLRKQADTQIKEAVPEWKQGKDLARKEILTRKLMDTFKDKDKNGYVLGEFLGKESNLKKIRKAFSNPEDAAILQKIEDWAIISQNLTKPKLESMASRAVQNKPAEVTGHASKSGLIDSLMHALSDKSSGAEAVKILTNPKWNKTLPILAEEARKMAKKNLGKLEKTGRVASHATGKFMDELNRKED